MDGANSKKRKYNQLLPADLIARFKSQDDIYRYLTEVVSRERVLIIIYVDAILYDAQEDGQQRLL